MLFPGIDGWTGAGGADMPAPASLIRKVTMSVYTFLSGSQCEKNRFLSVCRAQTVLLLRHRIRILSRIKGRDFAGVPGRQPAPRRGALPASSRQGQYPCACACAPCADETLTAWLEGHLSVTLSISCEGTLKQMIWYGSAWKRRYCQRLSWASIRCSNALMKRCLGCLPSSISG